MRKWLGPIIIGLVVALVVWLGGGLFLKDSKPATGTLYTVQRGTISAVVRTTGRIEPVRQVKLSFRAGDIVRRILVKPGDAVPTGTLLMELDTTQLQRQFDQAQTQYEINRFNQGAQAQQNNGQPTNPDALYSLARQAQQAETNLANAKTALENARLYAPFDGTVISVDINEGDPVNPGQGVLTLADLSRWQARADVDEIDVANVATGQTVQFSLDAFPGKNFNGQVTLVSPAPQQRQGSTIYATLVSFDNPQNLYLRPGMAANLVITSLARNNVLLVPNRALQTIGLEKYVTRQRRDGSFEKVPVTVGLNNPDQSEIINGLNEGDKIQLP